MTVGTNTLPGDTGRTPFAGELRRNALWIVHLRWLAAAAVIATAVIGAYAGILTHTTELLVIAAAIICYNATAMMVIRGELVKSFGQAQAYWLAQILADMAALTGIVYFCGGAGSPLAIFYVVGAVCAAILLSPRLSYLVASLIVAMFCAMVVFPLGAEPTVDPSSYGGPASSSRAFAAWQVCVFAAAIYASVYLTTRIAKRLGAIGNRTFRGQDDRAGVSESLRLDDREMAQREKMVAIGTMAAGVAHEVGNPLACLSATVQLLRRSITSAKERAYLDDLGEQIQRIAKIVRQLLDFARPPVDERVPAELNELIEQTVRMVRYSSRSRHARIENILNDDCLPKVCIIPQQFQQVLVNLLLNSLDAVRGCKGTPVVAIERTIGDGWVNIHVKDQGPGMTKEQIRQAFEPFYTTKPPGEGTGLGLAVSYRLVEQQGGRLRIDSTPGRGTTATVSFRTAGQHSDAGFQPAIAKQQGRCECEKSCSSGSTGC